MTRHRRTVRVSPLRATNAVIRATLGNGLRVVVARLPHLHEVHMVFSFRAGPRFETRRTCGLSHFLEHAVHVPALMHSLEAIGADLDAATAEDACIFPIHLPLESLDEASALLARLVLRPPRGQHIEDERARVLEEIVGNIGRERLDDVALGHVFPGHPLGMPVLGDAARVEGFDLAALGEWHRRLGVGRNAVLVVAGPVEAGAVMRLAARDWESMPPGERSPATAPPEQTAMRCRGVADSDSDETAVRVCVRAPAGQAAVEALNYILDDGDATRLTRGPRVRRCYEASCALLDFEDVGVLEVAVSHREPAPVVGEILALLAEVARTGPTTAEMERLRRRHVWGTRGMLDSAEDVALHYGREALLGREPLTLEADTARLVAVTAREVRDVARAIVRPERLTVVASGPHQRARTAVRDVVRRWKDCAA